MHRHKTARGLTQAEKRQLKEIEVRQSQRARNRQNRRDRISYAVKTKNENVRLERDRMIEFLEKTSIRALRHAYAEAQLFVSENR